MLESLPTLAEIAGIGLGSSLVTCGALYLIWGRPLGRRMRELEGRVASALPSALEDVDRALDERIALMEAEGADQDQISALRRARATGIALPVSPADKIAPPDPGLEYRAIDNRAAIALAKQDMSLRRNRQTIAPREAALEWPMGTVFKDAWGAIYVITAGRPMCIYRDGEQVEIVADHPLEEFRGGKVDLLVTVAELRANHLIR